jgi:hypothetical protein
VVDSDDGARGPNEVGEDGGQVSGAAADVEDATAGS